MRLALLGPLELRDSSGVPVPVTGVRQRALLCRLALEPGRLVTVDRLIDDVWDAEPPAAPGNALQSAVSRLRRDLDRAGPPGRGAIGSHPAGYRLTLSPALVDLHEFRRLTAAGTSALRAGDADLGASLLTQALALWRGPALAGAGDAPFVAAAAAHAEELRLSALEGRVAADLARGGDPGALITELTAVCAEHPLREGLTAGLLRALVAAGRRADALERYEATRRLLADRLGVDPGPELRAAHLEALREDGPAAGRLAAGRPRTGLPTTQLPTTGRRDAARPVDDPAAGPHDSPAAGPHGAVGWEDGPAAGRPSAAAREDDLAPGSAPRQPSRAQDPAADVVGRGPRGNLPAALTSFLGREEELRRVSELLAAGRLVTLTGPGGAGKTRLALEAAATLGGDAWLVELAGVAPHAVADAVLTTLARPTVVLDGPPLLDGPPPGSDPAERLGALLRTRRLLLVLDNAEHIVEQVAEFVTRLLAVAPGVRALVTSREPLGVVGEALCPVAPLPDERAAELFAARAAAVQPGFAGDPAEVLRICRALDGLPLAIELAAARLRSLSLTEVASRLDDRFALLGRGSRGGVARHRTLRAVMDGSWELLSGPERALLRRLSVFAGPASLPAVDAVCAGGLAGGELPDVVGDLVDRSLLVPVDGPGGRRYRLLETVRAYAAERLAEVPGEADQVAVAHTAYFLDAAERTEPLLRTGEQLTAIARFQAWHADLDAATARALAAGTPYEARVGRRLVAARLWFWWLTGQRSTAATWATRALAAGPPPTPATLDPATGLCLLVAGTGGIGAGRAVDAPRPWRGDPALLEAVVRLDHPASMFAAASLAGVPTAPAAAGSGNSGPGDTPGPGSGAAGGSDARGTRTGWMADAAARFAHHPDPWCRAASRILAGHAAWDAGDADRAHAAFAAGRALFTPLGERWGLLLAASSIAMVTAADDPAAALAALRHAERLAEELDGLSEIPELLVQIATLAGRLGDASGAAEALERAEGLAGDDTLLRARIAHARGEVARYGGDLPSAASYHRTALALVDTAGPAAARFTAQLRSCLARVEAERGSPAAAEEHAHALRLSAETGDAPLRADVLERYAAWCATHPGADAEQARVGARALGAAWALRHPHTEPPPPTTSGSRALRAADGPGGGSPAPDGGDIPSGVLPEAAHARSGCVRLLGYAEFAAGWRAGAALADPERTLAP